MQCACVIAWGAGPPSAQEQHASRARCFRSDQLVEVDPARHRRAAGVPAVPVYLVSAGRVSPRREGLHAAAEDVVYGEQDRCRSCQIEENPRAWIEGIGHVGMERGAVSGWLPVSGSAAHARRSGGGCAVDWPDATLLASWARAVVWLLATELDGAEIRRHAGEAIVDAGQPLAGVDGAGVGVQNEGRRLVMHTRVVGTDETSGRVVAATM